MIKTIGETLSETEKHKVFRSAIKHAFIKARFPPGNSEFFRFRFGLGNKPPETVGKAVKKLNLKGIRVTSPKGKLRF
ncbi:hypothetical protein HZC09_02465 [Candidatus Micrarchaeota archaeon]|nr:hypothetical protein [Candidatus Micrarchaeota archaeon]